MLQGWLTTSRNKARQSGYLFGSCPDRESLSRFATSAIVAVAAKAPDRLLGLRKLEGEDDHRLARDWVEGFVADDIPKNSYQVTYARSSGPGGQHVNKTSSKAVLRFSVQNALGKWLPRYTLEQLAQSPHYLPNPPSLLISSQTTRSAAQNATAALDLLHRTLHSAALAPIEGETSVEQKDRVKGLMAKEKAKRRAIKDKQRAVKASRRGE